MGRNLPQMFGPSFVKCYTFHIAKQQHIILSQTVQSFDCTTVSRMCFVYPPPRHPSKELPFVLLSLCAQLRENPSLSPAKAIFGTPIVLPKEFLQGGEFSIDEIVKIK
jgi:hypothetical protein